MIMSSNTNSNNSTQINPFDLLSSPENFTQSGGEVKKLSSGKIAAKRYLKMGWKIIPLYNYEKYYKGDWRKFIEKPLTNQDIDNWGKEITGIAVITGKQSNLTVIDDDCYAKGNKLPLTSSMESQTASGGRHLFFKYSAIGNANIRSQDNDYEVQEDNKLIVLPPSRAKNKQGKIGVYKWISDDESKMSIVRKTSLPSLIKRSSIPLNELVNVSEGNRHNSFLSLCNKQFSKFPESDWGAIEQILRSSGESYQPAMSHEDVERCIGDAKRFILSTKQGKKPFLTSSSLVAERIVERKREAKAPTTGYKNLDKLIGGFIPSHLYVLTGHTNVGKSTLAANFSVNLARQGKKVLYYSLEPGNKIIEYMASIHLGKHTQEITDDELLNDLSLINENVQFEVAEKSLEDMVKRIDTSNDFDLIVIDHIGYFISGKDVNQAQSNALKQLASIAKEKQCAIMCIAHLRKGVKNVPSIDDISGSGSFKQDATEVLCAVRYIKDEEADILEYSNAGAMIVMKTKVGKNGAVPINFSSTSLRITEDIIY